MKRSLGFNGAARLDKEINVKVRRLFGIGLGSSLEWYDFALYGFFVPVFAKLYFPVTDQHVSLLKAFSFFAIGFLVRPIGGLLFGRIGDKYGRVRCLQITPLLITLPTVFIAFLPTYEAIGIFAPLLLLFSRIVQGLFIGGEYAGNMVYMCESSVNRRYFLGSLASCTGSFGIFLASSISSIIYWAFPIEFVESYGWRLAFLLSILLGISAYYMRRNIGETLDYVELRRKQQVSRAPVLDAIRENWGACLIALCFLFLHATTFYAVFTFMPALLSADTLTIPGMALRYVSLFLFCRLFLIPLIGLLAEHLGGKKVIRISALGFLLFSYPLFNLVNESQFPGSIVALGLFAFLTAINAGVVPGLLAEMLPTKTRYTTFSFALNAGFGVFGGLAPLVLQYFTEHPSSLNTAALYLMFCGLVALIGSFLMKQGNYGIV